MHRRDENNTFVASIYNFHDCREAILGFIY